MEIMYKYCSLVSEFVYIAVWVSNSETAFTVYQDLRSKYILDNEHQVSHCQRKELQVSKGERVH